MQYNFKRQFVSLSLLLAWLLLGVSTQSDAQIDYGADKVNGMGKTAGTKIGGADVYRYLALVDHPGPSGVPVGGIGVGCFDYAPDGRFTRIGINNWHSEGGNSYTIGSAPGTFLAIWRAGKAHLLQRGKTPFAGMPPANHTVYTGLFPVAQCHVDDLATVRVWSGLVPQNVKDSSLPLAWIEVKVTNATSVITPVAVAFSWQDVLGRNIRDVADMDLLKRFGTTAWARGDAERQAEKEHKPFWATLPRVPTQVAPFQVNNLVGIRQYCAPLQPVLKTYQNYNNEVAILAEQGIDTHDTSVTTLPAYRVDAPDEAWASFRRDGRLAFANETRLFEPAAGQEKASAVAVRLVLHPHETRTVRFLVSWFQPERKIDPAKDDPATYFGKADYARYYHNYFHSLPELIAYAAHNRERTYRETVAWQTPILSSTYPEWLKFKLINSAYTLYTNTILNKAGDFTVMEGGMGGLAGTMDQRLSAHPFYYKFFTQINRADLAMFGRHPGTLGQILHFDGHYYFGLDSPDGQTPVPDNWMVDNTGGWLVQIARDYEQSGDRRWIEQFRVEIRRAVAFLDGRIQSKAFQIPTGPTTYDDFWHPEIYAYNASTYPCFLRAASVLFRALGETSEAQRCADQAEVAAQDALRALWNGRFFAYGADLDGSHRRDDIMFSGQLAGQFLDRCFNWGDVFPLDVVRASVVAQLKTNVCKSPDYYAPKVWLIDAGKAMNDPRRPDDPNADSTCWPFYLESYTAMSAIQAGSVDDGLEIMRHIQLLNLRNGWTWSQNLWRPGELTYVTAPVTWFITDVLAGSGLDVPNQTLHLAPVLRPTESHAVLPIYFPRFWATVSADRNRHLLTFKVTHVFGASDIVLRKVVAQPVGLASSAQRVVQIPAFTVREGATLDLSSHWNELIGGRFEPAILSHADKTPFLQATPKLVLSPTAVPETAHFVDSVVVSLQTETPGAAIFYTTDGRDPRLHGRPYNQPLMLTTDTTLRLAACAGKEWSPVRQQTYSREPYRTGDLPATSETGRWNWRYYEGPFERLPDFSKLTPLASGETDHLNLDMRRHEDHFALVFEGVLEVRKRGLVTFHLASDDGSRLTVGGRDVLENDGIHDTREKKTLAVPLEPGHYSLKLEYFQGDGGYALHLDWELPDPNR